MARSSGILNLIRRGILKSGHSQLHLSSIHYQKAIKNISATAEKLLKIDWNDGTSSKFPFVWLRDCDPHPDNYLISGEVKARKGFMPEFDVHIEPSDVNLTDNQVTIKWPDSRQSIYTADWLQTRDFSEKSILKRRKEHHLDELFETWESQDIAKCLPRIRKTDMINDKDALHEWLIGFCKYGLALAHGCGNSLGFIKQFSELIGWCENSIYGPIWTVETKADPSNLAYLPGKRLGLHTDSPCNRHPPDIQMLHCVKPAVEGGANEFTDGFRVAEALRLEQPKVFDLLTNLKIEYIDEGIDERKFDMMARHPVIRIDSHGKLVQITFSQHQRSWCYFVPPEEVLPVYEALKMFMDYCRQPRHMFHHLLREGDMVVFANDRLLHARTEFKGDRVLEGCYMSWNVLHSKIRQLREEINHPSNSPAI